MKVITVGKTAHQVSNDTVWTEKRHINNGPVYEYETQKTLANGKDVKITLGNGYKSVYKDGNLFTMHFDKNGKLFEKSPVAKKGDELFVYARIPKETISERRDVFKTRATQHSYEPFYEKIHNYLKNISLGEFTKGKWIPFSEYYNNLQYVVSNPIESAAKHIRK